MAENAKGTRSLGDAKAHFAECVREVESGETVVLTRHGRPVARLVPYSSPEGPGNSRSDPEEGGRVHEIREPATEYGEARSSDLESNATRKNSLTRLLEEEIWPQIPEALIGQAPTKQEREEILGIGGEVNDRR